MSRSVVVAVVGFGLVTALVVADAFVLTRGLRSLSEVEHSVLYSRDILAEIDGLRGAMEEAAIQERFHGYSRAEPFWKGLEEASTRVSGHLDRLRAMVADDPIRRGRFNDLNRSVSVRMGGYWTRAGNRRKNAPEPPISMQALTDAVAELATCDAKIATLRDGEVRFLQSRADDARSSLARVAAASTVAATLALAAPAAFFLIGRIGLEAKAGAIRRREAWLDATLRSVGDPLIAADAGGRVAVINPAAEALTGWTAEEAKGRPLPEVFRTLDRATRRRLASPVVDVLRHADLPALDDRNLLIGRRGGETPIEETISPILGARGAIEGAVLVFRDVSGREAIESERDRVLGQAESANQAKDRFLAVLSHELRTPLNPVLLATSALIDGTLPAEETAATLAMIRRNVELEARLIEDLLDVSRIVQGKLTLNVGPIDVHAAFREAVETCRGDLDAAGIRLAIDLAASRPIVLGDPARLQQVGWNLIKNAVKFTPRGGLITVRSFDRPGRLVIEVEDTGLGMAPATLGRIFEPFQQGDHPAARRAGGLGLGLAISRSVVAALGGSITATSPGLGRGSTFRVELPGAPETPPEIAQARPLAAPSARALRILLVEDDETTLALMSRLLGRLGHETTTAETLAEAFRALESGDFDLILSDLGLPDGSGLDLIRRLGPDRPIPAIALTGHGMEEAIRESLEAGFALHMTKPIDLDALKDAIDRVTSRARPV